MSTVSFSKGELAAPALARPAQAVSLSDAAFEALRNDIVEGRLRAGEPLRQDLIAAKLGVSKIPLREALTRLEHEGLVVSYLNRGFIASPLCRSEAVEAIMLRLKLEPDLAGRAGELADADERRSACDALQRLRAAAGSADGHRLARVFRQRLYAPARSPMALAFVERMTVLTDRYAIALGQVEAIAPFDRLCDLLDAWMAGDRSRAEATCSANLSRALAHVSGLDVPLNSTRPPGVDCPNACAS